MAMQDVDASLYESPCESHLKVPGLKKRSEEADMHPEAEEPFQVASMPEIETFVIQGTNLLGAEAEAGRRIGAPGIASMVKRGDLHL